MIPVDQAALHLDGFGPLPIKKPDSIANLGELIREAAAANQAIYPISGRTHLDLGGIPSKPGWAIDLAGLDEIIDFPARDMTVTCRPGITLASLQATLAKENLRLPIDVPRPETATLGGAIAANISGPRRFGCGTLRDYVIGISAVNDEGREFKAGGRVVKNVAGYDICKLLVGSLGTLGVVSQVTLKLRPLAEEQVLVTVACPTEKLAGLLEKLHGSATRPVIVEVVNRAGGGLVFPAVHHPFPDADWLLLVGYEGNSDAVKWQMQQIVKELSPGFPIDARLGFCAAAIDRALVEWPAWPTAAVTLKACVVPGATAELLSTIENRREGWLLQAHAGNGIIFAHRDRKASAAEIAAIRASTASLGGMLTVSRCPSLLKREIEVWGPPPKEIAVMRRVKELFDPRRLFNPGRFIE